MPIKIKSSPIIHILNLKTTIPPWTNIPLLPARAIARIHTGLGFTRRHLRRIVTHAQLLEGVAVAVAELDAAVWESIDLPVHAVALCVVGSEVHVPVTVVEERGRVVYTSLGDPVPGVTVGNEVRHVNCSMVRLWERISVSGLAKC